ncbi:MAG: ribosome small subunit-dependent GTPase A [Proteobacteria bacterium]|nr:ribosome small subunit-dependent GTPase A [Pseudomonadota bacterium]MBU1710881.1 ribosome small subunit-dependent GTPase A [Pseudomonadota bacterium]
MNNISNNLEKIGFGKWLLETVTPEILEQFDIARVVAVHRDSYSINNGEVDVLAELVGKLIFSAESPVDYPAVGDWVLANYYDENTFAIIHAVLSRKSLLKRKTPGKKVDFQLIAANIDVAFIVQSLNENFNLRRLERYLVMVNEGKIQPIVLLSKSDLLASEDITTRIDEIQKNMPRLHVIPFSSANASGLDSVKEIMQPGLTYCLLGSSGVGKTTLVNNLIGESKYTTKTVSRKESKGRHATTHRQMIKLDSGAMIVDTPGMRELGNFSVATGLDETFSEIITLSEKCRFNDCTHAGEKGCAVLDAVVKGQLSDERYQNYVKMTKESSYNEMSYLEKRKKDKQFGKLIKTVMKDKKSRR